MKAFIRSSLNYEILREIPVGNEVVMFAISFCKAVILPGVEDWTFLNSEWNMCWDKTSSVKDTLFSS